MTTLSELIAGKDHLPAGEVADWLNTPSIPTRQLVPLWRIAQHGRETGWWYGLKQSQSDAAAAFLDYYNDPRFENLDLDLPAARQVMSALVTQPQADQIDALADRLVSPAEHAGLGRVGEQQIIRERMDRR